LKPSSSALLPLQRQLQFINHQILLGEGGEMGAPGFHNAPDRL
jgi:hypothetical protein